MIIRTQIGTRDSARQLRSEPSGGVTATNVQQAIDQIDTRVTDLEHDISIREVTEAGDAVMTNNDGILLINKAVGEPTDVLLDPAASFDHAIQVKDKKLDAATNNIRLVPNAVDVNGIDGLADLTINTNGGGFRLVPTELGWVIG